MILLTSLAVTILTLPIYKNYLTSINSTESNFQGKLIPIGVGFFILFMEVLLASLYQAYLASYFFISLLIIATVGTYDDLFGNKKIKGLKGHMVALFNGNLTSGFLKAFFGGVVSLLLSVKIGENHLGTITHFLLILFMMNTLNLFDLRPGRAIKVFFVFLLFLGITTPIFTQKSPIIMLGMMLVVFFQDVRAKIMLGDSGANLLGLHLGYWSSLYLSLIIQWSIIIFLLVIHFYSEKKSISKLIEEHKFLKEIDSWGRKGTI